METIKFKAEFVKQQDNEFLGHYESKRTFEEVITAEKCEKKEIAPCGLSCKFKTIEGTIIRLIIDKRSISKPDDSNYGSYIFNDGFEIYELNICFNGDEIDGVEVKHWTSVYDFEDDNAPEYTYLCEDLLQW